MSKARPFPIARARLMQFLAVIAVAATLAHCSREPPPPAATAPPETKLPASYRELPPAEAAQLIAAQGDLAILDFRTEKEWVDEGHLPNAQLVNFFRNELRGHLASLDRGKSYFLCCAVGERSRIAAGHMAELGFAKVSLLAGGMNAWKAAGRPVEK